MFGKSQNKPATEVAAQAPAPVPAHRREIDALKDRRATSQAEFDLIQREFDEADERRRNLHAQREELKGQAGDSYGGLALRIYPETPLGRALTEASDRCNQLRGALEGKRAEVEKLTEKIQAVERELPGRLRREALEAAMPLVFELIDALCVAAAHESEYVSLGGPVEQSVPWEFALAGGDRITLETIMSRWLQALKREGIRIPGDICDDSRHLPAPAGFHARVQDDIGHAGHAARCGAGGGFGAGFRQGYLNRARSFF